MPTLEELVPSTAKLSKQDGYDTLSKENMLYMPLQTLTRHNQESY